MLYDDAVLLTYCVSNRLIISMFPSMDRANGAIGKAFSKAVYLEDDALSTGAARTAAFMAW